MSQVGKDEVSAGVSDREIQFQKRELASQLADEFPDVWRTHVRNTQFFYIFHLHQALHQRHQPSIIPQASD